ncbi:T9SS type A sorting domain-containing protein [Hymenobacter daeguensis]
MNASIHDLAFSAKQRIGLAAVLLLLAFTAHAAVPTTSYSTSNSYGASSTCGNPILCLAAGQGVLNADRAANSPLTDYATLYKGLSLGSTLSLKLGLAATGQIGDRAGIVVAPGANLLGISALGTYTLVTYKDNVEQQRVPVSAAVLQSLKLLSPNSRPMQLEFVAATQFNAVELVITGAATLGYTLNVYYAYSVSALQQQPVRGLVSKFTGSNLAAYYSTAITPIDPLISVCANSNVTNPENAVDTDLTNYARFGTFLSVNCPTALSVKLEGLRTAPAGYYAGFMLGSSGLLDLSVLSKLRLTTYRTVNGVRTKQESATGANLLDLKLLPNGQYQVSFATTLPFDEVQIEQLDTAAVLSNLNIYYGFGVEPSAFVGTTRILSDFAPATAPAKTTTNTSGVVCGGCGVTTPQGAADNDPNTKAVMNVALGAVSTVELKVDLNGTGAAGYRAGMVISNNNGLLDASVLDRLTLTTYDLDGNVLESAAGSSVLSLNLLPDGKQEIAFLTTQNFASVQLSATSTASLGVNINVYQAFADNLAGGLITTIAPLPVQLSAFSGKWVNGAAELNWATASEKNSSHFVVERSVGGDAAYKAVGQVTAAGNSSSTRTYQLRDAEAGTQGAATLYYRLRQVDLDGTQTFSPVVAVAVGKLTLASSLELYPNPTADAQTVMVNYVSPPAAGSTVLTYSELGQLVSAVPATAATRLQLPTLAPGLYHVVLRDAAGQRLATQRLVVSGR